MSLSQAAALVESLRAAGVRLSASGERLSVEAPAGAMTPALAEAIRTHKPQILRLLDEARGIAVVSRDRPTPLGIVQERMWAHAEMEPEALLYNLPAAWRFKGPLDVRALVAAFDDFVARHEALRLRIVIHDGLPRQVFAPAAADGLAIEDLGGLDGAACERELARRIEALRTTRFDLAATPFVARLFRLSDNDHALFFMPHHLAWDGWCFDIFLRDLRELYAARIEGRAPDLPRLRLQYADYGVWHRRRFEEGAFDGDLAFWESVLKNGPPPPNLPSDRTRPELFSAEGDWTEFSIDEPLLDRVKALAAAEKATTFMTFLTLWRSFLARITGEIDIVIGAPIQARQHADLADVVGCFVNTIFLRQKIDLSRTTRDLLREARAVCLDAYQHQEAPVELLVDRLGARDPSRTPIAQVMFTHQHVARRPADFGAAALSQIHVNPRMSPTDLMFAVMEGGRQARALIHFATGVFSPRQAQCLARAFESYLRRAVERPDEAVLKTALAEPPPRRSASAEGRRLPELIAETAARSPEKIALSGCGPAMTYGALMARSAALARWLADKGVAPGDIVGLMTPRSPDMVALALAIWRCGAAYLPLDPSYPAQRLAYMVEDSGAKLVISASGVEAIETPARRADVDVEAAAIAACAAGAAPDVAGERAYVIYTSGSTGRPKGVENSHRSLANFIASMLETPGVSATDRLLAITTLSFDISILELFAPLAAGGEVVIAGAEDAADGGALLELIARHRPTILQATPATWRMLIDGGLPKDPHLKALCGGEALAPALAAELVPRVGELWNMYGPTETTVWSTCKKILSPDAITIGGPIAATDLYVVGPGEMLMPDGVPGELWIGGEGVAIGYLRRPELTAEKFRVDPFAGAGRVYRTGDLARRLPDGDIEHLGRIDAQVKLRGFRIELGEIEAALEQHEAVARAVAAVKKDAAGEPVLAAYIVLRDGAAATGTDLRRFLRRSLPSYMLPQHFVEIAAVPLTGSGKIDRAALKDPVAGAARKRERTPPRTDAEKLIAGLWSDILKVSDISIGDNFFELGGNSLQAAQMAARYRERSGVRLAPRSIIFETLEQLAAGAARR
jgi:amino acid adenylation domain-containing protein